jgi:hypothetical protein
MIIFLDIDGVLCAGKYFPDSWNTLSVVVLKYLISKLNAKLVITSAWRKKENRELLNTRLEEHDLIQYLHEDRFTPVLVPKYSEYAVRAREIETWLINHRIKKDYLILDDVWNFFPEQKKNVYITNSETGLRPKDAIRILEQLGIPIL